MQARAESRIPVTLVTGFLGAGKTSWLNRQLRTGQVPANSLILVNDFGQLNIDAELIVARDEQIIRLADGCICCTLGDNLAARLSAIGRQWPPPAALYIEGSGVADTGRLRDVVRINRRFEDRRCLCLVDASSAERLTAGADTASLWRSQISGATDILVNRTSAGVPAVLAALLADRMDAGARVVWQEPTGGTVPSGDVRGARGGLVRPDDVQGEIGHGASGDIRQWEGAIPSEGSCSLFSGGRAARYRMQGVWTSKAFSQAGVLRLSDVDEVLTEHADSLLRVKGWLRGEETGGDWRLLNFVPGQLGWSPVDVAPVGGRLCCVGRQGARFEAFGNALCGLGFEVFR